MLLLSTCNIYTKPAYKNNIRRTSDWHTLCKKYLPPMIVSGIVGAGTGSFVKYIEKELKIDQSPEFIIWLAAAWYSEYIARNSIIASIQKDFDDCNIPYKKNFMYIFAWITSWMTYVHA
jgi:hypothetical protein